jgi:NhaP-type Na+/H+ or K+/H+ antiporter
MTGPLWFLLVGGLLLVMGLTPSFIKRLPVTSAIIYLSIGLLVGPTLLNAFHFNPLKESALLEVLTEVAVLISLFTAGVKMPAPMRFDRWRTPLLLASASMGGANGPGPRHRRSDPPSRRPRPPALQSHLRSRHE